jgi:hypothetical protein
MADNTGCKHQLCNCPATGDSDYCSDHCRDIADQDITEIRCDCGHPGCG